MSMLSQQAKALRSWADQLAEREDEFGVVVRALVADLREAANTIENLRDSLNEVADKWAGEMIIAEDYARENMMLKANNGSRWFELFGTPERAARTLAKACGECSEKFPCSECPLSPIVGSNVYESEILEWLRGESE